MKVRLFQAAMNEGERTKELYEIIKALHFIPFPSFDFSD
jgi:hypothetical protein